MLGRYFEDLYNLNRLVNKKVKFSKNLFHDTKDLRFNLINYILLLNNKKRNFMNLGLLFMKKIFYLKFYNLFNQKLNIYKIEF